MENHENHENHENYIEYPLQDGYINRFAITEITAEPRRFKKMPLAGKVNEWLKKGFSIHENPCRKEMLAERLGIAPPSPAENVNYKLYFPFGNIGVEQSAFYYVPTYLRRYGKATLHSKIAARKQFQLETCGAATIWLNGKLIVDFTPFTRNMVKST
ncbi:MAG: hypothetical protein FWG68_08360, partial [Defluviitaleaceae bacterium]|nr:hypothetical protein [Defluviitaleaceae bacterium]